jgi:multidrug efflux pump subunit AcrA (membrane-fusion protein)
LFISPRRGGDGLSCRTGERAASRTAAGRAGAAGRVEDDNVVEQRKVRLGTARDGMMPVDDGVKAGERVVIQGQQRIRAGIKVTPQPASAPAG